MVENKELKNLRYLREHCKRKREEADKKVKQYVV